MKDKGHFKQCGFKSGDSYTVAWVPEPIKVGMRVSFKDDKPACGRAWTVEWTGARITAEEAARMEKAAKDYWKMDYRQKSTGLGLG